ncbi:MAG: hypothetical protein IJV34_04780 [Prevotella sp.]|nr:hypothetical protein [Prevotella sp.]
MANYTTGSDQLPFWLYSLNGSSFVKATQIEDIDFDEEPTHIDNLVREIDNDASIAIYTLSGTKVATATQASIGAVLRQLPPAVYIVDGRKFVAK